MIKGTAHIAITAKDMDESLKFYTEAMGFKRAFELNHPATGDPWIVYLNVAPGQFVELFYGGTDDNPWKSSAAGFNHLCFEVDDIEVATRQVQDAGYTMTSLPKQGVDMNWQSWVTDPNGIRIELMQISPESPQGKFM